MPPPIEPTATEADRAAASRAAAEAVQDFYAVRCWGYDPNQHAEFETFLANRILAGVLHERERAARVVEREPPWAYDEYNAGDIADLIRRGPGPLTP